MEHLLTLEGLWSLLTLTALEIVLGIDNIVFISIVAQRLPENQRAKARTIGLSLALIFRILLLLALSWIAHLTQPLLTIQNFTLSYRDVILWAGGLFLLAKSTIEIHNRLEGSEESASQKLRDASMGTILFQIVAIDLVFSLDSIITAIGLVDHVVIIIIAVTLAMLLMIAFAGIVARFIHRHPTLKMLALAFLLLVGVLLVLEGFHIHVPRGYIYFAMAFSLFVELLNLRMRKKRSVVPLHEPYGSLENPDLRLQRDAESSPN